MADGPVMVRLLFEPGHKVLLAEFSGRFTLADVARLDVLVTRFMAGRSDDVTGIMDFSKVDKMDVSSEQITGRAQQPQMRRGQRRIFVATTPETYGLCRMFAAFQAAHGSAEPEIVRSLQEAYSRLGLTAPRFEPVDQT